MIFNCYTVAINYIQHNILINVNVNTTWSLNCTIYRFDSTVLFLSSFNKTDTYDLIITKNYSPN